MMQYLALEIMGTPVQVPSDSNIPHALVDNPTDCGASILSSGLNLFLVIGIAVAVIFVTWAGVKWISSGESKQKLAAAKNQLYWAIIGLIIMFCAFLIVSIIGSIFTVPVFDFSHCKGSGSSNAPVQSASGKTAPVTNSNPQDNSGQASNTSLKQDAVNLLKNAADKVCQNVWVPYFLRGNCPAGQASPQ
jgi:hypothetical protein